MKIDFKIYEKQSDSESGFVEQGVCNIYVPKSVGMDEHATVDLGDQQILLDLRQLKVFAKKLLGHKMKKNVVQLHSIAGGKTDG